MDVIFAENGMIGVRVWAGKVRYIYIIVDNNGSNLVKFHDLDALFVCVEDFLWAGCGPDHQEVGNF